MFSGAEIQPHSQWNLGDFFPQFLKKQNNPNLQKKFFEIGIFIQSPHTRKLHGDILLQFNGNSIHVTANLFFN